MTRYKAKILTIDDEKSVCIACKKILEDAEFQVDYTLSPQEGIEKVIQGDYDVVLLDLRMPEMNGIEVLETIKQNKPDVRVVIITGYATIQTSIEAVKKGAFDYVSKPFTPEELTIAVKKALEDREIRSENRYLKEELTRMYKTTKLIGRSKAMEDIMMQIRKIAPTSFTVTVYGESGTGKELIAQAIHEFSNRNTGPFVAIDLSTLTSTLVESELFGHVRGAYTGATQNRPGYFTIADGGTLFLDEVSNVSWELQGKLLRVLESHRIRPVGSDREHEVDVRIITATNQDLFELVEAGKFREDLYYRLNVIPLNVPPLRDRSEDIPLLATFFLQEAKKRNQSALKGFTTEAMAKMVSYHWPGNVREIRNVVERIVATEDDDLVRVEHLPDVIAGNTPTGADFGLDDIPETAEELKIAKREIRERLYAHIERHFLWKALERAKWNVTHAAELVGMERPNFHAMMRKYGIRARE
ncbi:MAG: sigma-54-dependent Fis family transcriptional regulator [Bradymonadales bacterium]|nr:sigma-54-dependent Fis family transcriptional regulator [Bradymonadales bacterium]